ncbi:unnamed protein product [Anisakis simplex]|uniref:Homeobox protein ceh-23 (inferred by orthology to a C. elegans protein) n=1 Tax=Anisakis simplex TaxID=6269 RepID=A0A0M3JL52_ANISI|nr:unnamed protein product [Anisakis simplex]
MTESRNIQRCSPSLRSASLVSNHDDRALTSASQRKQRTIYGASQTRVLERAFEEQQYMVGTERELLAERLGLSEAQVRVWFQNRRSKWRKQVRVNACCR